MRTDSCMVRVPLLSLLLFWRHWRLWPHRHSLPSWGDFSQELLIDFLYLVSSGVLADEDEEDEAAPEKVDTSNDPKDKLSGGETLHVPMIPMDEVVDAFKYPEDPHHSEQLAVQQLQTRRRIKQSKIKSFIWHISYFKTFPISNHPSVYVVSNSNSERKISL